MLLIDYKLMTKTIADKLYDLLSENNKTYDLMGSISYDYWDNFPVGPYELNSTRSNC